MTRHATPRRVAQWARTRPHDTLCRRAQRPDRHARPAPARVRWLLAAVAALLLALAAPAAAADEPPRPNVIILLCDNLGYGDIGCFGSQLHRTPHVDRLAQQGRRLTSFYSASGVCTPSRASLMTGCYPRRVSMHRSDTGTSVLQPVSRMGLHPDEVTLAEVLRAAGYATACIGKWHLGDQPEFLPTRQGFDEFFGIPYSDDMTPRAGKPWPPLPLMRQERVVEAPADRTFLTQRYTQESLRFIRAHREQPFFLYLAHAMPGSTAAPFASPDFQGRSRNGPWGDAVEELDWSTGQIIAELHRLGLDRRTLVLWTSDNGAPRRDPPQGSNLPLAGWGYSTAEGGMRVPCIAWWPGRIPPCTTSDELCTLMDLLPTLARLAGGQLPRDRTLDGHDIGPLLWGPPDARSPYDAFYYYHMDQLQAVRSGPWKLYLPLEARLQHAAQRPRVAARLYHLQHDIGETRDLAAERPDIVARLAALAQRAREDLGDLDRPGRDQRPAGWVDAATPRVLDEAWR